MKIKHTILAVICAIAAPQLVSAQEEPASAWTLGGSVGLTLNQASFCNWAAGGENSLGANAQLNYSANYKLNKHIWDNRIELAYGINNTETTGNRKTNDKIYLSSIYGYQIADKLYLSGLLNFQTQFADGYTYSGDTKTLASTIMSPGYLTVGLGLTWTPQSWLTATFTPATWREVFVLNDYLSYIAAYGVDSGKHSFAEAGANLQVELNKDVMENVNLYSRLILFSNYLENPQNVDVNWEVQINLKINKWLSANISTNLVYDDNINITKDDGSVGPALQFKEALGVGIQIKL